MFIPIRHALVIGLIFSIPIGWYALGDVLKRHRRTEGVLSRGIIIGVLPREGTRSTVEIKVDNGDIVRAYLMMDTPADLPERVTFYYGGDPNEEVHCREETDPIWFLLIAVIIPISILAFDFVRGTPNSTENTSDNEPHK